MYPNLFTFAMCISLVLSQTCPLKCPSCTRCDAKKGTCSLARDFVTCTTKGVAGVCFAGGCNTKISIASTTIGKCQTYNCPPSGPCSLVSKPDGSDCTPLNVEYESICLGGICNRVWLGLGETFPYQNIGCKNKPNGAVCDTNHVLTDGETCVDGICKFPDGTYYGYAV